ncbi:MAG: amidohydrolase family protein, partial [Tissierellia bacterium]|nr:amidohydrolase family protein [Tissierellia bacterium]
MVYDLIIKNGKVFIEDELINIDLFINEEKIVKMEINSTENDAIKVIDAKGMYVLPGGVDPHVHIRDPGHTERETFLSGTMAAAAGGVTTIIEHPISNPPQYNPKILKNRINLALANCVIDFAFLGAAGSKHLDEIENLSRYGIVGYKTFLHPAPTGREFEFEGLTMENDGDIIEGLNEVKKTNLPCVIHAENDDIIKSATKMINDEDLDNPLSHALSRPLISEVETVEKLIRFSEYTGAKIILAHTSSSEAMSLVKKAKLESSNIILETCPHYLLCCEKDLKRLGVFAKCNPPLRSEYE